MALEDHFLYKPLRVGRVDKLGADVFLDTPDGVKIHGRYVMRAYAHFNLLYLHGRRGNLATRAPILKYLVGFGTNLLAIDYRGYGQSQGEPSEAGLYNDALAAYQWLTARAPAKSIIVMGEGLGGAPACQLAAEHEVGALVLASTFTNLPELAATRYPWLPTSWVVRSRFDVLGKLPDVRAPKLIVHAREDELVPFEMGERLFEAATEPKTPLWLDEAEHAQLYSVGGKQLAEGLGVFLRTLPIKP